jgi:SAM-dependent methyltransferase
MDEEKLTVRDTLNAQQGHWEKTFSQRPDMFGSDRSEAARKAAEFLRQEGKTALLELGCGQGRDTLFFAQNGFQVTAADYSQAAVRAIEEKAQAAGVTQFLTCLRLDVRQPLPFADQSFEACYSHMLYCMALTTPELERLSRETWRVLKPGGINIFTVRHTGDPHCGTGIHRGEDMWEVGSFIVHFFSREKVLRLAEAYEIVSIEAFEEGGLPRKLFWVALRKG